MIRWGRYLQSVRLRITIFRLRGCGSAGRWFADRNYLSVIVWFVFGREATHTCPSLTRINIHWWCLPFTWVCFTMFYCLFEMLCCKFRFCSLYVAVVLVPSIITLFKLLLWNSIYLPSIAIGPSQCIIGQFLNIGHASLEGYSREKKFLTWDFNFFRPKNTSTFQNSWNWNQNQAKFKDNVIFSAQEA